METLTFITGNANKAKYLRENFHIEIEHKKVDLTEIQSVDLGEIVTDKAKRAYEIVKSPVLVEDVSLEFKELGSLPGPFIKWFDETLGNQKLCELVGENRNATARVMYAHYDGTSVHTFEGSVRGTVAKEPRGDAGFGWNPIFIPDGQTKTWGEMNDEERFATAMRKPALEKLSEFLASKNSFSPNLRGRTPKVG